MTSLNLKAAKTALLSMDIQKGLVRRSAMFREHNVAQRAKDTLQTANAGILIIHVAIDYQRTFFQQEEIDFYRR